MSRIVKAVETTRGSILEVVSNELGRPLDLGLPLAVLATLKFGRELPESYRSFSTCIRGSGTSISTFCTLHLACVVASGYNALRLTNSKPEHYDPHDVIIARAVASVMAFRKLNCVVDKNRREKIFNTDDPRKLGRARNIVIFLAMILEQTLAFQPPMDVGQCMDTEGSTGDPRIHNDVLEHDPKVEELPFYLAYLLQFVIPKAFPSSQLAQEVYIDDKKVSISKQFWATVEAECQQFGNTGNATHAAVAKAPTKASFQQHVGMELVSLPLLFEVRLSISILETASKVETSVTTTTTQAAS